MCPVVKPSDVPIVHVVLACVQEVKVLYDVEVSPSAYSTTTDVIADPPVLEIAGTPITMAVSLKLSLVN